MLHLSKIGLSLFLFIFLLNGCKLDSLPGTITVTEVEDEFYIDLWESLSPDSRNFSLKIRTIENQECVNTTIEADLSVFNSTLRFLIQDIKKPNDCVSGFQPATKEIDAGELVGAKIIHINLKNTVENKGNLVIDEERYLLDMETENGFLLLHDELLRVPKGTIWGYVIYQRVNEVNIVDDFLSDLQEFTTEKAFKSGYYGHFTITNNVNAENRISVSEQPSTTQIKTFIHNQSEDKEGLIDLLADYRSNYSDAIEIKLLTADGEEL